MHSWGAVALALVVGCSGDPGSGAGGSTREPGVGGAGGSDPSRDITTVAVEPSRLSGTRIGQRWPLTAIALDASGEPITGVDFTWDSSNVEVAEVTADGLVTAIGAGEAQITVMAAGHSEAVELISASAVPSDDGEVYTTWFARSDDAPVAIVEGRLEVFGIYPDSAEPTSPWPHPGVERFQWAGDRLAILTDVVDGLGTLRVLDRHEEWTVLRVADAMGFELSGDWIVELGKGGSLRVKEGLRGPWTTLAATGVEDYQVEGDRIAILQEDGLFRVKDGIDGQWTVLATEGVRGFELHGDRIAVLTDEGPRGLKVKDGIDGLWTDLGPWMKKIALSGDRIGVLREDGVVRVKDGLDGEWTLLASSYVEDLQLEGERIAMMFEGGDLRAKDEIDGPWTSLSAEARTFVLQGDYIGMETKDGGLWFKAGLEGTWSKVTPGGAVTQLLPVADVPVAPARVTPSDYAEAQERCIEDGPRCAAVLELGDPVPHYGRFCGSGRPLESDWSWAVGADGGPMDAFDALCMHQDHAPIWYPETMSGSSEACIVRYGLTYARLTRDGTVLAPGTEAYDETMSKMPHLRDAIADDAYQADCDSGQLDDFIEATSAKH